MLRTTLITLAIGCLGAALAFLLGIPAPFLTGPATFVSVAAVLGVRCLIPIPLRNACFLLIGMNLGSSVTPEAFAHAAKWPVSLVGMIVAILLIMVGGTICLQRLFGFERLTALLASTPGHLSFVLGLTMESGANVALVSVVQSLRILMLTLLVPASIALLTDADMSMPARSGALLSAPHLAILLAIAVGVALVFTKARVPAGYLLAGMTVSTFGHGSGLTPGIVPPFVSMMSFVTMGTLIGTRFTGITAGQVGRASLSAIFLTVASMALVVIIAYVVVHLVDLPFIDVVIALAPGALETMIAMASVIGADPTFVGFHHVARLFALSFMIPLTLAWAKRQPRP